jgi:hypothetical protein
MDVVLISTVFVGLGFVAQAFLHENPDVLTKFPDFRHIRLMTFDGAVTFFVLWLAVFVAHKQFRQASVPVLHTSMVHHERTTFSLSDIKDSDHVCFLRNLGSGRAIIKKVRYRLLFSDEKVHHNFDLDYFQMLKKLQERNLIENVDFFMPRIPDNSPSIVPGSCILIHISNKKFDEMVRYLDMHLTYESVLHARYTKNSPIVAYYRWRTRAAKAPVAQLES